MTRRIVPYLQLAGALALAGCAEAEFSTVGFTDNVAPNNSLALGSTRASVPRGETAGTGPGVPNTPPAESAPQDKAGAELAAAVDSSQPARERILIYTANLQVLSTDIEASLTAAQKICTDVGGYMDGLSQGSITMRVPAAKFFSVLEEIRKLGQVLSKSINAQDVTDEYVDLQLRLKNAEATRDRLLAILEKAQTVKDTLEVERELSRVREEIERIKGRLTVLDRQTSFSTITVNFMSPAPVEARRSRPPTPFAWLDSLGVEHVLQLAY